MMILWPPSRSFLTPCNLTWPQPVQEWTSLFSSMERREVARAIPSRARMETSEWSLSCSRMPWIYSRRKNTRTHRMTIQLGSDLLRLLMKRFSISLAQAMEHLIQSITSCLTSGRDHLWEVSSGCQYRMRDRSTSSSKLVFSRKLVDKTTSVGWVTKLLSCFKSSLLRKNQDQVVISQSKLTGLTSWVLLDVRSSMKILRLSGWSKVQILTRECWLSTTFLETLHPLPMVTSQAMMTRL